MSTAAGKAGVITFKTSRYLAILGLMCTSTGRFPPRFRRAAASTVLLCSSLKPSTYWVTGEDAGVDSHAERSWSVIKDDIGRNIRWPVFYLSLSQAKHLTAVLIFQGQSRSILPSNMCVPAGHLTPFGRVGGSGNDHLAYPLDEHSVARKLAT